MQPGRGAKSAIESQTGDHLKKALHCAIEARTHFRGRVDLL